MHLRLLVFAWFAMSCGSHDATKPEPGPVVEGSSAQAPDAKRAPRTVVLAELPVRAGAPLELRNLKVMKASYVANGKLTEDSGDLELRVSVKPTGSLDSAARLSIVTTCRIHDVNLTFDEDRTLDRQMIADVVARHGGEVSAIFHSDPFKEPPQPCELVVRYRADKATAPITVAVACYRSDTLAAGECPAGTFPPPPADQGDFAISPVAKPNFRAGSAAIQAMFTLAKPLAPGEQLESTWRCRDGKSIMTSKRGEDSAVFWTPAAMAAGTSAQGSLTTFLEGASGVPQRCEIAVAARAGTAKPRTLGTFCVDSAGAVTRGACPAT